MPDVIICANFGSKKSRGLGYTGVKLWVFPSKWLVTLTTVLRMGVGTGGAKGAAAPPTLGTREQAIALAPSKIANSN